MINLLDIKFFLKPVLHMKFTCFYEFNIAISLNKLLKFIKLLKLIMI